MTDRDSTQTTWERPCGGSAYAHFCEFVDKMEMDLHNALRDALGADRTLTPGREGSIPSPAANDKPPIAFTNESFRAYLIDIGNVLDEVDEGEKLVSISDKEEDTGA